MSKGLRGQRKVFEKKVFRPTPPPSFSENISEIKSMTTRTAKQLTSKNLLNLSNENG